MNKLIKSVGINETRAKILQAKSIELMLKSRTPIKESQLVNFMIDELTEKLDIDQNGIFLKDEEQE